MEGSIIQKKSFDFALRIIHLYKTLSQEHNEYVLSKQLLRSGTAIGSMVAESKHAESKMDFIHKMALAQKEANESLYWIELLYQSEYIDTALYNDIAQPLKEIQKIIAAIIVSSKKNHNS